LLTKGQRMEYREGMQLQWTPYYGWQAPSLVTVVQVKSRGCAKLSNGWVVDRDGVAEGTDRQPGGIATIPQNAVDSPHPGT
jgi:hypothetical protein